MKKILSLVLTLAMLLSMVSVIGASAEEAVGYTYGDTFYSEEPVTYSMYFSDASWYPMVETWQTEGVFKKIEELTNVTIDVHSYDSGDYNSKTTLEINAGQSAYIIPKVYDESPFVDGGAVVAVSDYVQYMPNYTNFYEKYNLKGDVDTIVRSNGSYYRLPGMHETPLQDYTLMIRDDIFKAAGYDVATLEKDWTWDDLCEILVGVKAYLVAEGKITEDAYIWSDLWCGSESGQGNGGNLLKLIAASYDVPSGWAVGNGMMFDAEKNEWYFASTTEDYKEFVTVANKFISNGILDPETFTQDDTTATNKFYNGETVIMSMNRGQYTTWMSGLETGLGEGNYSTYVTVYPKGSNNYVSENSRLECGVMISNNALKDLGEDGFIKMMRFVDWLWYGDQAYDLTKWGTEGETYEVVTDEAGNAVKQLLPGFKCGGLGISGAEEDVDIRLQWGYAGGNFWYGHSLAQNSDNFIPVIRDYFNRMGEYRDIRPINPSVVTTEDENEQMNLWKTPLIDNVNAWTLQFVTGQKDITADWDAYVASCNGLNAEAMVQMTNEAYARTQAE